MTKLTDTIWIGDSKDAEHADLIRRTTMASVETPSGALEAQAEGFRTFRVRPIGAPLLANEIECPASEEAGHKTQCIRCLLCDGKHGPTDKRKNISIAEHGGVVAQQTARRQRLAVVD